MSKDSSKLTIDKPRGEGQTLPWSPWIAVVFVVVVYFVSQFVSGLLVSIYPALHHWSLVQANDWLNNNVLAQFLYVLIAESLTFGGIYAFMRARKVSLKAIGLRRPRWSDALYGLGMLPLYYLSYIVLVAIATQIAPSLNINQQQQIGFSGAHGVALLIVTFISLVILPPLVEEIMMRGFLYTSLKKGLPKVGAALVTSVIFASAHLQAGSGAPLLWIAAIDTFTLSLFLVYLREKTDGLWASMTLHALKNGIAFISLFILHLS